MAQASPEKSSTPPPAPAVAATATELQLLQIVQEHPSRSEVWFQLGTLALGQGRHKEAVARLEKAVALDPDKSSIHQNLALAYQGLGNKEKAAEQLSQVVRLKPDSAVALNDWGIALAQLRQLKEASSAFAKAIKLQPDFVKAYNNRGNVLAELKQFDQAEEHFRLALKLLPTYPEAHRNLGLLLMRMRRLDESIESLKEARRVKPDSAETATNLGVLYRDLGRLDESLVCCRDAVRLSPSHAEPRFHLALTLARLGKPEEAIDSLQESLLFDRNSADTYHHLGMLFGQLRKLDQSAASFRQAVDLRPENPDYRNQFGQALLRQQNSKEAIGQFQRAVELRGDHAPTLCNLGIALMEQGRFDEAVGRLQEAVKVKSDYCDGHFNLGNAQRKRHLYDEALTCYQRALELQPNHPGALLNIGIVHTEHGRLDRAIDVFTDLLKRKPDFCEANNCLGIALLHQQRPAEALVQFDEGLKRKPEDAEMHLNRSLCLLLMGNYQSGWPEYEWRWKLKKATPCPVQLPAWDGTPLPNGTIVLWAEQGLGDTIQFIRYAPLVKERVGKVLLACPAPLRSLLARCPGVDGVLEDGATPNADVQAPLLTLPRLLGTTLETIPATVPYLERDSSLRPKWRRLVGAGSGFKIGLVWQGNPRFTGDRYRSVALEQFRPLAKVPGVELFSLQKGQGAEQLAPLAGEMNIVDLGRQIASDFSETAAAINQLDLVIAVDTSVAHLAGALGKPVWILLPANQDWRWLIGRDLSLWYPTARLFRQQAWGDWSDVLDQVAVALDELIRSLPQPARSEPPVRENLLGQGETVTISSQGEWAGSAEVVDLTARLKTAQAAIDDIGVEMSTVAASGTSEQAIELVRRFAQAHQQRSDILAQLASPLRALPPNQSLSDAA